MNTFILTFIIWVIEILSYPGLILRLVIARFTYRLFGARITESCYLRFGFPIGYHRYQAPRSFVQYLLMEATIMLLVAALGLLLGLDAVLRITCEQLPTPLEWAGLALGLGACMSVPPEDPDSYFPLYSTLKAVAGGTILVALPGLVLGLWA